MSIRDMAAQHVFQIKEIPWVFIRTTSDDAVESVAKVELACKKCGYRLTVDASGNSEDIVNRTYEIASAHRKCAD